MPIYPKLTIARLSLEWHAPTLRSDSIFLSFSSIVRPNYLMLSFLRVTFIVLGGQKDQHDDSLGSCTSIHYISTLFPPTYDMRWLIDGKLRALAAKVGDFTSI